MDTDTVTDFDGGDKIADLLNDASDFVTERSGPWIYS
jgi:hypothetical protein